MKKITSLSVFLVLTLLLSACGGGSSNSNNGTTGNNSEATLSDDVLIQEDLTNIASIKSPDSKTGEILFNNTNIPNTWSADKVILFPPSDTISSGIAVKINEITEEKGKTKVSYTTPSIDELFTSINAEETAALNTQMVKSFSSSSGVKMSASVPQKNYSPSATYRSPSNAKIDNAELEWFPSFGRFRGEIQGRNGSFIDSLNFAVNKVVIVRTKDKEQAVTLSGEIKLKELKIHHKLFLDKDVFGKPDLDTLQLGAQIDYKLEKNLNIESKIDLIEANMAELPGVMSDFSCAGGNQISTNIAGFEVELKGANWPKTDICLGAISLNVAGINVKDGRGFLNLSPSLDLFLIMGMDLKLSLKASWNFKEVTEQKLGLWLDRTKAEEQLSFINSNIDMSKENIIQGSIDGSLKYDTGVAIAFNILNIKPLVARGYATLNLNATAKKIYHDANSNDSYSCLQGNFSFNTAASFHSGLSADLRLLTSWPKGTSFGGGVSYDEEIIGNTLFKYDYDSCNTKGLSFDNNGNSLTNLTFKDASGATKKIKDGSILWKIYKAFPFALIKTVTANNPDISDLENGDYVIILTLQDENGVEYTKTHKFSHQSNPNNLSASSGDTQVTLNWSSSETNHRVHYATSSFDGLNITNYKDANNYGYVDTLGTSTVIKNLTNGTKYYFTVTTQFNEIQSVLTQTASATPSNIVKPILSMSATPTKAFLFTFSLAGASASNANYYKLSENKDGVSGFKEVATFPIDTKEYRHNVSLIQRLNARYILSACSAGGVCVDSNELTVNVADLAKAIGYFKASNTGESDNFGYSVALSADGNTLAVGAHWESSQGTGINSDTQSDNSAGFSGAVYVFIRTGSVWSQQAYVKASNTGGVDWGDNFGSSVALSADGNTLAVGAVSEGSNGTGINPNTQSDDSADGSGAVYVFSRTGGDWSQQAYVKASNTDKYDYFGESVALSADGNTLAVGADGEDSQGTGINPDTQSDDSAEESGAVYVFSRTGSDWSQQAYVKASNTGVGDYFGSSVALSANGNTLAVGASGEDSQGTGINSNTQSDNSAYRSGAVYVFIRTGSVWSQQAYVKASNTDKEDWFGSSVALSADGNTLAVGAYGEASQGTGINPDTQSDNGAEDSGAVYVFIRTGSVWSQQAYVKASNTGGVDWGDNFGSSVALSADGNTLAVGARYEGGQGKGINPDTQSNNSASVSGAVYVFSRTGSDWSQQAYVKASNTGVLDHFGESVALSEDGNTLAVGARYEASKGTGINSDTQSDNSANGSGAVYLY